jgi:Xaa-Pro aminopeptidase
MDGASVDVKELARRNRQAIFNQIGDSSVVLVAAQPHHVFYCSGYKSMGFDTSWLLKMAVVFVADDWILVGPKADLWSAAETVGKDLRYFCYGNFFFDDQELREREGTNVVEFATFDEAVSAAVAQLAGGRHKLGIDSVDGASHTLVSAQGLQLIDARATAAFFRDARSVKNPLEISLLRSASDLTEVALGNALRDAKAGMTEYELAARISAEMISQGGLPGFVVVTSGERSALADAYPTRRRIGANDIVRIDVGATFGGYWSDTARTAFVGEPGKDVLSAFAATSMGHRKASDMVAPGMTTDALFHEAVAAVRQGGLPQYKRHHVGHGLGIESHEHPTIAASNPVTLLEGMVVNIEAPYYRPGWGGMMSEDTFLVTATGAAALTRLDRGLFVIPA